ncbi:MAG: ABC transporter permease, partial [Anaerolineales bacterium]|nr:ABC transporter permease [Anaerolineales bacterium]
MSAAVRPNLVKPRWSKVLSDLWGDKTRTILVVASIAAGVFAVGAILTAFVILQEDINLSYASANPVNIEVRSAPFREDLIRVIEKVPGVDEVEGRRSIGVRARKEGENWQGMALVGVEDFERASINQLGLIAGTLIPGRGQVLISDDFINNTGFLIGDEILVEAPDGAEHTLEVVGLVSDQTSARPDANNTSKAFVTIDTLRAMGMGNYYDRLLITVDGDGSDE